MRGAPRRSPCLEEKVKPRLCVLGFGTKGTVWGHPRQAPRKPAPLLLLLPHPHREESCWALRQGQNPRCLRRARRRVLGLGAGHCQLGEGGPRWAGTFPWQPAAREETEPLAAAAACPNQQQCAGGVAASCAAVRLGGGERRSAVLVFVVLLIRP